MSVELRTFITEGLIWRPLGLREIPFGFNEMREACFISATRTRLAASVVEEMGIKTPTLAAKNAARMGHPNQVELNQAELEDSQVPRQFDCKRRIKTVTDRRI